ncbi:hypothetical protein B0H17DRAFT_1131765 [Mycena rosella]|uniref:Uncharacterized protein n=1 Tax=Mycena rosella TaxID=1033263 RepID=A0AAD7GLL4_MYCRO|nr:hypothetical protein B0H17DRAFT_1131765 [Mycena rosella]
MQRTDDDDGHGQGHNTPRRGVRTFQLPAVVMNWAGVRNPPDMFSSPSLTPGVFNVADGTFTPHLLLQQNPTPLGVLDFTLDQIPYTNIITTGNIVYDGLTLATAQIIKVRAGLGQASRSLWNQVPSRDRALTIAGIVERDCFVKAEIPLNKVSRGTSEPVSADDTRGNTTPFVSNIAIVNAAKLTKISPGPEDIIYSRQSVAYSPDAGQPRTPHTPRSLHLLRVMSEKPSEADQDFWRCKSSQQPPPVMLPPAPREEDAQETLEGVRVTLSTLPKAVEGCRTRANQALIRLPAAL